MSFGYLSFLENGLGIWIFLSVMAQAPASRTLIPVEGAGGALCA
jgi:hypothetical protein